MATEIIERILGWSNQAMLDRCLCTKRTVNQTKTRKTGRGRATKYFEVLKYSMDSDVLKKIDDSVAHYKALLYKEKNN
jgi:hypothetical protein